MCAGSAPAQGWVGVGGGMPPGITSIIKGLASSLHNAPYRTIAKAMSDKALILFTYSDCNARLPCLDNARPPPISRQHPPIFYRTVKKEQAFSFVSYSSGDFRDNLEQAFSFQVIPWNIVLFYRHWPSLVPRPALTAIPIPSP